MPAPSFPKIDSARIPAVGFANAQAEAIYLFWHGNQVNVVGHQTISPNRHPVFFAPFGHQFEIGQIIRFTKNVG